MSPKDKKITNSFILIDNTVIQRHDLTPNDKMTYFALSYFATLFEQCYPAINTIAELTGASRSSVIRGIKRLECKGLIQVCSRKMETNLYMVFDGNGQRIEPGAKRKNFTCVDWEILSIPTMSASTKVVYLTILKFLSLSKHKNEEGCHPSFRKISQFCGLSKRAVINNVLLLRACKIVKNIGRWGKSNWYHVIERLADASVQVKSEVHAFFGEGKKSFVEKIQVAKNILLKALHQHQQITDEQQAQAIKTMVAEKYQSLRKFRIPKKIMVSTWEALEHLYNVGVKNGIHIPMDINAPEMGRAWLKSAEVKTRLQGLTNQHILMVMERVHDRFIGNGNLKGYIMIALMFVVFELPPDYQYDGIWLYR